MFDGLADWLGSITWPLVTRVLASMGIGTLTYKGADTALSTAIDNVVSAANGLTGPVLQLISMAGFFDALSISAGGFSSGLAWLVLKRWVAIGAGVSAPT